MARRPRSVFETVLIAAAIAVGVCGGWKARPVSAQPTNDVATITGFSIPEVDDKGEMKWKVLGDFAKFNPRGGPVDITGVRLEMYKNANVDMVLTSPQCLYDRDKREAETESPVRITGKDMSITGNGFYWSGTNNMVVIRRNARVVVNNSKAFVKTSTNQVIKTGSSQENTK